MSAQEHHKNKYPISKSGKQCIGPCYEPNTTIIHPQTMTEITNDTNPFCPTVKSFMDKNGVKIPVSADLCVNPTHKKDVMEEINIIDIIIPQFVFEHQTFLSYFEIYKFDDAIKWLSEKAHLPIRTRERVVNSILGVYSSEFGISDVVITDFFVELVNKKWIKNIYKSVRQYVGIDKNGEPMIVKSHQLSKEDHKLERANFIVSKYCRQSDIQKVVVKYITTHSETIGVTPDILPNIEHDFIEHIKHKIEKSIE